MSNSPDFEKNHADRLMSAHIDYPTLKEKALAIVKEGVNKGYTVVPTVDDKDKMYGMMVFKKFGNQEIAYNPVWPQEEGKLESSCLLKALFL